MEREKNTDKQALPHSLSLQDRKKMAVSGVNEVVNFDENQVTIATTMGTLVIRGSSLHVDQLSLDSGELRLTGRIDIVEYDDSVTSGGFLRRLFQ
ncbi:sporulation protein YabP [Butyricicoccus sp.]|uniref:sporulation protein YabP n=1 Tax=Butyricicoccus sp. TaxID=2049021 RepID=UPI002A84A40D|nr:sporulation protein YabP [Butyricicoccus sp.]